MPNSQSRATFKGKMRKCSEKTQRQKENKNLCQQKEHQHPLGSYFHLGSFWQLYFPKLWKVKMNFDFKRTNCQGYLRK